MNRIIKVVLALAVPSLLAGQQISQLPRTTSTTGLNDSALVATWDSTAHTRAATGLQFRKMLSLTAFDSLMTGRLTLSGTVVGTPTWASIQTFHVGQLVDSATGSFRAQKLTTARTIGGTSFDGTANIVPAFSDSATGAARAQKLTTARTIGGTSFDGTANITPALSDSATGAARAQILTTSRNLWNVAFNGSASLTARPWFSLGWSSTGRDSLLAGSALVFAANDTVYGTPVWNATQAFATGQRVDSATGAARSQVLTTARTINGTSFNGSADITVTAAAGTLTGSTLAAGVTSSSLTSFGAGARTDSATGAARAQILTTARSLWGNSFNGSADLNGVLKAPSGGISAPSYSFSAETNSGLYWESTARLALVGNGTMALRVASTFLQPFVPTWTIDGSAAAPSYSFNSSTNLGLYRFGADTLGLATGGVHTLQISGGATAKMTGGAGNMTVTAGTGNSRTMTLQTTNGSGVVQNTLSMNSTGSTFGGSWLSAPNGTVSLPGYNFGGDGATGLYGPGSDTLAMASNGTISMRLCCGGGAGNQWIGGAGSLTVRSGIGASLTTTLQTTNASSVAINTLVLGADSNATLLKTQAVKDSSLKVATTQYVDKAVAAGGASFPLLATNGTAVAPSYSFTNSTGLGAYRFGADTMGLAANGRLVATVADSQVRVVQGRQAKPTYSFTNDGTKGLWYDASGGDIHAESNRFISNGNIRTSSAGAVGSVGLGLGGATTGFWTSDFNNIILSNNGVQSLTVSGGATTKLTGGAGSMTVLAGTGASRTLTLQTTESGSTAKNTLVLGADTTVTSLGSFLVGPSGYNRQYGWAGSANTYMMKTAGADTIAFAVQGTTSTMFFPDGGMGIGTSGASLSAPSIRLNSRKSEGISFGNGADSMLFITGSQQSMSIAGGASPTWLGAAGNLTILAGTGASRTMTLKTTNASSVAINTLALGADSTTTALGRIYVGAGTSSAPAYSFSSLTGSGMYANSSTVQLYNGNSGNIWMGIGGSLNLYQFQANSFNTTKPVQHPDGTAALPSVTFSADSTIGLYRHGTANSANDTLGFTVNGVNALNITNGANSRITGGAGSMQITAGTGNARTMTLQSTSATGVATTFLTANTDTVSFAGQIKLPGGNTAGDILVGTNPLYIKASVTPAATNTYDLGDNTRRWNTISVGQVGGGTGSLTVLGGSGNSRTVTIQSTNGSGSTQNNAVFNADGSTTFLANLPGAIWAIPGSNAFGGESVYPLVVYNGNPWTTGNNANAFLLAMPFTLARAATTDTILIDVTTLSANDSVAFGIYDADPSTYYPTTRLATSGTVAVTSTGQKKVAVALAMTANKVYWMAFTAKTSTPQFQAITANAGGLMPRLIGYPDATNPANMTNMIRVARTWDSTIPSTFTAGATPLAGSAPAVFAHFGSITP